MTNHISSTGVTASMLHDVQSIQRSLIQTQQEVQLGQRVRYSSDDPKAMSIALQNQSEKRITGAFEENRNVAQLINAESFSQISNYQKNVYLSAQEISFITASRSTEDLQLLGVQINGLIEIGMNILQSQSATGEYLFGGDATETAPFAETRDASGNLTDIQYAGASTNRLITVADGERISPQLNASHVSFFVKNINNLINLRDALNSGDPASIKTANQNIQADETPILTALADVSATATRLDALADQNRLRYEVLDESIADQIDSNFIEAITRFQRSQMALEAAMRTTALISKQSIFNYF